MTMITPSYLGETIEYSSLHACRSTLEDPTKMVEERLERQDCNHGCVFDGFPRTVSQAIELGRMLERRGLCKPAVIEFRIESERLLLRLSGRWTCSVNGESYNVYEAPPKVPGVCDFDGGNLTQ